MGSVYFLDFFCECQESQLTQAWKTLGLSQHMMCFRAGGSHFWCKPSWDIGGTEQFQDGVHLTVLHQCHYQGLSKEDRILITQCSFSRRYRWNYGTSHTPFEDAQTQWLGTSNVAFGGTVRMCSCEKRHLPREHGTDRACWTPDKTFLLTESPRPHMECKISHNSRYVPSPAFILLGYIYPAPYAACSLCSNLVRVIHYFV